MKITVKIKDVEISIDENDTNSSLMKHSDENKQIQSTINLIVDKALEILKQMK